MSLETIDNPSPFKRVSFAGATFWVATDVWNRGFVHGFGESQNVNLDTLKSELETKEFIQLKQIHGDSVFDLSQEKNINFDGRPEADAIVGLNHNSIKDINKSPVLGIIQTADCVPIIIIGKEKSVIIHAGWRGLCNGIVSKAISMIRDPQFALIGPCARECCYQIGEELVGNFMGLNVVSIRDGKYYLSTSRAATLITKSSTESNLKIFDTGICTICDTNFNSYRRDQTKNRNINFLGFSL